MTSLKNKGGSDGHIHILRGKIRRTHKNTKGEDQTDTYIYIYIIRFNSRAPLKQKGKIRRHICILRGKIRRKHIYIL